MRAEKLTFALFLPLLAMLIAGCAWREPTTDPPLDAKIGQMLMIGFRGTTVGPDHFILQDIRNRNLGGVILFDYDVLSHQRNRNVVSPDQVKQLVAALRQAATTPLLVAIDQEGGAVARLKESAGFPATVSHGALGRRDNLEVTAEQAGKLAATLAGLGINLNLAPVVDLCVNPDNPVIAKYERCFAADPQKVTAHAISYIMAHHSHGILTSLKHFPGHGSSRSDSHLGFSDVTGTWTPNELAPFRAIIASGYADTVMTAHVFNAQLDPQNPATLSGVAINQLLRGQLGFSGVVLSDDMQMGAIRDNYDFETAIYRALGAGVDILVFGNNLQYDEKIVPRAIAVIRQLVTEGRLSEERIDRSYRRIMRLKNRL